MAIIRWDPLREFDRFFHEDWGFVPMIKKNVPFSMPSVDIYEKDNAVIAELEVPAGVDPEKVEISVEDNVLYIRGASEEEKEKKEKDYFRREIRRGSFERTIMLPAKVKDGTIQAVFEKGILMVTMPKREVTKGNKVKVTIKK